MRSLWLPLTKRWVTQPSWRPPPTNSVVSEQLELGLYVDEPWEGRSPRGLTRGHLGIILKPEAAKHERYFVDPDQLDMFTRRQAPGKGLERRESPSACTLLPLPWGS